MTNPYINLSESIEEYIIDIIHSSGSFGVNSINLAFDDPIKEVKCDKGTDCWLISITSESTISRSIDYYEYCGQTFLVYIRSQNYKKGSRLK